MVVTTELIPVERYKIKPGPTAAVPDAVVDHDELVGVTPEMIDWWRVNMEKDPTIKRQCSLKIKRTA
jgi:hypothetical protein